ncbi:MAG: hypothetical protein ABSG51_00565, partial [Terracidiphilus sp.]
GTVVSRISSNLLNDELLGDLPREDSIRESIYIERYCKPECDLAKKSQQDQRCSPSLIVMNAGVPINKTTEADELKRFDPVAVTEFKKQLDARFLSEELQGADVVSRRDRLRGYFCGRDLGPPPPDEDPIERENRRDHLRDMFLLQEGQALLYGQDKVERLKQYHDQAIVLRGATFNGFVLAAISLFCWCGNRREHLSKFGRWRYLAYLPSAALIFIALLALYHHVTDSWAVWHLLSDASKKADWLDLRTDPPLVELLLLSLGATGYLLTSRTNRTPSKGVSSHGRTFVAGHWLTSRRNRSLYTGNPSYGRTFIVATVITLACYSGWWWTEYLYDSQVIYTLPELHSGQKLSDIQAAGEETPPPAKAEAQGTKAPPTPSPVPAAHEGVR